MWTCEVCETQNQDTDEICSLCGAVRPEPSNPGWVCENCGTKNRETTVICSGCGMNRYDKKSAKNNVFVQAESHKVAPDPEREESTRDKPEKKKLGKSLLLLLILLIAVSGVYSLMKSGQDNANFSQTKIAGIKATETRSLYSLYKLGEDAYWNEDYSTALKHLVPAAEAGSSDAQFRLGYMYSNGEGVTQSDKKAVEWYQKAADQGHSSAQNNLGVTYEFGKGVDRSYVKAAEWYQKAANQGEPYAQNNLGRLYESGNGVKQSNEKALEWYQKAADQGHERAKQNLKNLQEKMKSTPKPTSAAAKPTVTPTSVKPTVTPTPKRSSSNSVNNFSNLEVGDIITFGRYEQDNNTSNGPEPIEWQVINIRGKILYLLSVYGLELKPYNEKLEWVTWETCSLRKWLNTDFYNSAFDSEEKAKIDSSSYNNNPNNPDYYDSYGSKGCAPTRDNVFLLSGDEMNWSFPLGALFLQTSEYVNAKKSSSGDFLISIWWLRSPGLSNYYAATNGHNNSSTHNLPYNSWGEKVNEIAVVRPLIRISY